MKRRKLLIVAGLVLLAAAVVYFGWWRNSSLARRLRVSDEKIDRLREEAGETIEVDLARDRERMWRTVPSSAEPPQDFEVSPVSAINSASRVFKTISLEGKTLAEVNTAIGTKPRPRYGYDFPFHPVEPGVVVYRFDCGLFGWQFNLRFDEDGRVSSVERKWIR